MESIAEGLQLFQRGGIVMYALLACSLFVVYVGVERWLFYQRMDAGKAFAQQFYTYMKLKKYDEACEAARRGRGGLALILSDAFACDDERRGRLCRSAVWRIAGQAARRLYYLSVIVTMAPLLGLLGTISGMITSFSIFNVESGRLSPLRAASARLSWRRPLGCA